MLRSVIGWVRGRLTVWITLAFLVAGAVPVLVVGLAAHAKIQSELVAQITATHRKLIEQARVDLLTDFEASRRQLEKMVRELDVQRMDPTHQKPALETFLAYNALFTEVAVYDRGGKPVAAAARGSMKAGPAPIAPGASDPVAVAFAAALASGRTTTTPPAKGAAAAIAVLAPVPSFVDGLPPIGVAVAQVRLQGPEIQDLIAGWEYVDRTYLYVTDGEGRVLAQAGTDFPAPMRSIRVTPEVGSPGADGITSGLGTVGGRADLLASASVEALGLTIVAGKPYDEVERVLRELIGSIASYAIVGVLLALVLGVLMARRVSGPILALTAGIRRVAGGEVAHRIAADDPDELGRAADAFNAMATRMQRGRLLEEMWESRPRPSQTAEK